MKDVLKRDPPDPERHSRNENDRDEEIRLAEAVLLSNVHVDRAYSSIARRAFTSTLARNFLKRSAFTALVESV